MVVDIGVDFISHSPERYLTDGVKKRQSRKGCRFTFQRYSNLLTCQVPVFEPGIFTLLY